ncbi:MAG: hypothetical protein N3A58_04310 [Spirochaetes bacterium]|nr:hypothetical protein [Spirochaetota bacterium]
MFLWCKSINSFYQSTLKIQDIVEYSCLKGKTCFVTLTDYENVFDIWNFIKLAKENNVKPIVGVELQGEDVDKNMLVFLKDWERKNIFFELISYRALGYKTPSDFIEDKLKADKDYFDGVKFVFFDEESIVKRFASLKDRFLGVFEGRIFKGDFFYLKDKYFNVLPLFFASFKKEDFEKRDGITVFDIIISSDENRVIKRLIDRDIIDLSIRKPVLSTYDELNILLYKVYGSRSREIFDSIFDFVKDIDILKNFRKNDYVFINISGSKEKDEILLYNILFSKIQNNIFFNNSKDCRYYERLSYEYKIIKDKNLCSYFLFVYFLTLYVKEKGIPYIGRGSAASSLVSYLLDITQVDPVKYDLFFERFLNYGRDEPPDIDLDFSWKDRDFVIKSIFNREFFNFCKNLLKKYISKESENFDMYCELKEFEEKEYKNCAMIGTRIKHGLRGAFRIVSRYLGIPESEISRYSKLIGWGDSISDLKKRFKDYCKYYFENLFFFVERIIDLPYGIGTHPGGICIAPSKITDFCPIYNGVKGFLITGFDMYSIENTGLIKIDILSQRALGVFSDSLFYLKNKKCKREKLDYLKLIKPIEISGIIDDKKISEKLQIGDSLGCFYIESPAMRGLLKQLKCKNYLELVAASSVIRPGVSESGMKDKYIFYKNNPDKVDYVIPELKDILEETFGIMIYQEDVMKVAHNIGGLSYEKADLLRKGMSGKLRSKEKINELKEDFIKGALSKGYSKKKVYLLWKYMESFAGYSFCKAHSASYAILSYKLLYLKIYYPELFYASVIENKGGYYPTAAYIYKGCTEGIRFLKSNIRLYSTKTQVLEKENGEKFIIIGLDHLSFLDECDLEFFKYYQKSCSEYFKIKEKDFENISSENIEYFFRDFFSSYICFRQKRLKKNSEKFDKFIKLALVGFFDPFVYKLNKFDLFYYILKCYKNIKNNIEIERDNINIFNKSHEIKHLNLACENLLSNFLFEYKYYGFFIGKTPFDIIDLLVKIDFERFGSFNQTYTKKIRSFDKDLKIYNEVFNKNLNCLKLKDEILLKIGFFITGRPAFTGKGEKMGFATFFDGKDFFEVVIFPDKYERFIFKIKNSMFFMLKLKSIVKFDLETYELIDLKAIFKNLSVFTDLFYYVFL